MLNPQIETILFLDIFFVIFSFIVFVISIKIYRFWDINSTTNLQYGLEKYSFLASTIVKYILLLKIPLFLFFIYTLDKISDVLTGAMCAAGVIDATQFGVYLFIFKIINIYLFGFWLILHNIDIKYPNTPFTKYKFEYFIIIFILLISEIIFEFFMFSGLDINKIVSCCGTLFSSSATSSFAIIFTIDTKIVVLSFYTTFLMLVGGYFYKNRYFYTFINLIFLIIAIISLILFFSTYIYQLPTHKCPFCILQKDYYYIGYILYISLFIGTFYGIANIVTKLLNQSLNQRYFNISLIFNTIYTFIVSAYVVVYYIQNGVFL